jgi:hypothetical protein
MTFQRLPTAASRVRFTANIEFRAKYDLNRLLWHTCSRTFQTAKAMTM